MAQWGCIDALNGDDMIEVYRVNGVGPRPMTRAAVSPMKPGGRGAKPGR
jgi:hypothetical protein